METRRPEQRGMLVVGGLLVVVGALALAGNGLGINAFELGWPLLVLAPGLLMFALAVSTGGRAGSALAVPAGIVTMTAIVLSIQNATGLWATWAYAWALVAPGGVGIGLLAYGILTGQREFVAAGLPVLATGLGLFLAFGIFFEGVLGLNGTAMVGAETVLAGGLVVLGALILVAGFANRRSSRG